MKGYTKITTAFIIGAVVLLSGCDPITGGTEDPLGTETLEDLDYLRGMIPALQAGLALAVPAQDTSASSFSPKTFSPDYVTDPVADSMDTPANFFAGGEATGVGDEKRYPASGTYMEDYYGTTGNQAEIFIKSFSGGSGVTLYLIDLYIYPTLSVEVDYVHEQYLVTGSSWMLVNTNGDLSPTYYLVNETVYTDRRVENHVVHWTRYSATPEQTYVASELQVPDDPADAAYDYPSLGPDSAEPTRQAASGTDYSAKVVSSIASSGVTVTEYYTESAGTAYAASYVEKSFTDGDFTNDEQTVRRYSDDFSGTKIVRARTSSSASFNTTSTETTITEKIDVTESGGVTTYSSETTATDANDGTTRFSITMTLTESGAGTNVYSGDMVYTPGTGSQVTYTVDLDSTGLAVEGTAGGQAWFPIERDEFKELIVELDNGGTFTGKMNGGVINGLYRTLSGEDVEVNAALGYIMAIGEDSQALQ